MMLMTRLTLIPKHQEWLVKLGSGDLLGPYSYDQAWRTATVLAEVAWEYGYDASVETTDAAGETRTVWRHPAVRRERYV